MTSVTLEINITLPPQNSTKSPPLDCKEFSFIFNCVLTGCLCIAGIIANSLTIATLYRDSWKNVTSFLFSVLAASDVCALILTFLLKALPSGCVMYGNPGICWYTSKIWPKLMKYLFGVTPVFLMGSVWLTVLVTIHRTIAVKMPHRTRTYSNIKLVRIQTIILVLVVFLFCLPRFFEITTVMRVNPKTNETKEFPEYTKFFHNNTYQIWYKNVAVNVAVNVGPLIILCILTYMLVHELHKSLKERQALSTISSSDKGHKGHGGIQLSVLLILVVVVFICCQTPHAVYAVIRAVISKEYRKCGYSFQYLMNISDALVVFNSGINFFLFCLAGKRFRMQLKNLCHSCCQKKKSGALLTSADHAGYGVHANKSQAYTNMTKLTPL